MTLQQLIDAYAQKNFDRWHTPGHKGTLDLNDITELPDADFFPEDCVRRAEIRCANRLGVKHLRFLSGGSSMGIKAALLAVGGKVITGSNNHPAVDEGLSLARAQAVYVPNQMREGLPLPLSPEQIDAAIRQNPDAAAVLVLSPDYYGQCALAQQVAEVVRAHKKLLLVDAAHGAHFLSSPKLFPHSIAQYADAVNLSAHKTLNAYTQSAFLCICNESLIQPIDSALTLLGTTSPSYILYAQLENAIMALPSLEPQYRRLQVLTQAFRTQVPCLGGKVCPTDLDFTRLSIDASALGLTGQALCKRLVQNGIMPEKVDARYVVMIATPNDDAQKFERLTRAVLEAKEA